VLSWLARFKCHSAARSAAIERRHEGSAVRAASALAIRKLGCKACGVRSLQYETQEALTTTGETVRSADVQECIETFAWRDLRFHVVTHDPLSADQIRTIRRTLPKIKRVGLFAEVLALVLGRHVRIRTERPSPDIRFEVGR
jgi:hypothetical protein